MQNWKIQLLPVHWRCQQTCCFSLSRLDSCNSLLVGLPDSTLNKLQHIQNHAAWLVLCKPRHSSATSLLRTLHWLPVKARIQYKIACLCFQCIYQNCMPPYLSDLHYHYYPSGVLHTLDTSLLTVPSFSLETFWKRSFSVFGPTVWNYLPLSLGKTQCFTTFEKKLKTHLFETYLCWRAKVLIAVCIVQEGGCLCVCDVWYCDMIIWVWWQCGVWCEVFVSFFFFFFFLVGTLVRKVMNMSECLIRCSLMCD